MKPINTFIFPVLNNVVKNEEGGIGFIDAVNAIYKYTPPNFRIIVIFNGNQADFDKAQKMLGNKVHLWLKPHRNLGFGKSMNMGIKLAQTEFVTLANDDVEVLYPEWWDEVMQIFTENPDLGGFNPHSFINKAASGDRVVQYDIKPEYSQEDIQKMKEIFHAEKWYVGCCTYFTICKKAMFDDIGLFDESFGMGSGEDYDVCIRAARGQKRWQIAGGSRVMVKHWWGGTKDYLPKDKDFISNYDLIIKGVANLERKFGPHIDEVKRQLADGRMTQEQADNLKGGWSVSGQGGPDEPLDKNEVSYPDKKWFQEVDL